MSVARDALLNGRRTFNQPPSRHPEAADRYPRPDVLQRVRFDVNPDARRAADEVATLSAPR
ncbi:hypothetical protein [Mycobacterium sp.]|uniref:hypothetical protein n=1 Tax=Mycobacterium sp. TaxID=1785 RepID=UPI003D0E2D00